MDAPIDPPPGGCWPSPIQTLLLRALLAGPPAARAALDRWSAVVDLGQLDPATSRLLPMLHRRVAELGVSHPGASQFKAAHRLHWWSNTMLFRRCAKVLTTLAEAGVDTMVLKGAALAPRYYADIGCRPMSDIDILVPFSQAHRATQVLVSSGWHPEFPPASVIGDAYHGLALVDDADNELDLHWHLLHECCRPDADDGFWARSEPFELKGATTRTLARTDQLLHTLVHGVRWNELPPLRWIVDAAHIIAADGPALDWDALVAEVCARQLNFTVWRALHYLAKTHGVSVPVEVLDRLGSAPAARLQRREFALKTQPYDQSFAAPLEMLWHRHRRMTGGGLSRAALAFPGFVQRRLRCSRLRQVPFKLVEIALVQARDVQLRRERVHLRSSQVSETSTGP